MDIVRNRARKQALSPWHTLETLTWGFEPVSDRISWRRHNRKVIINKGLTFWLASMFADSSEWHRCTIFFTSLFILLIWRRATVNSSSSLPTVSTFSLKSSSEPPTAAPISARSRRRFVSSSAIRLRWWADRSRSCWSSEVALAKALWEQENVLITCTQPSVFLKYFQFVVLLFTIVNWKCDFFFGINIDFV